MDTTIDQVIQFLRTKTNITPDLNNPLIPGKKYKINPLKIIKYNDNDIENKNTELKKKLDNRLIQLRNEFDFITNIKKHFTFDIKTYLKISSVEKLDTKLDTLHNEYLSILENLLNNISIGNSHYIPLFTNNLNQRKFKLLSSKEIILETSQSNCPKLRFHTDTLDRTILINQSLTTINDLINQIKVFNYKHLMTGGSQELEKIFNYFYGSNLLNAIYELLELILKLLISKNYFYKSQLVSYDKFKLIPKQYFDILLKEQIQFYRDTLQHYLNNVKNSSLLLHWYSFIILLNLCNHILTLPNLISIKNDGKYINLLLLNKDFLDDYFILKMLNISKPLIVNGVSPYIGYRIGMLSFKNNSFTIFINGIENNQTLDTIFGTSTCNGFITNILEELNLSYSYTYFSLYNNDKNFTTLTLNEFHSLKTLLDFNNIFTILIKHTFILTLIFIPKNINVSMTPEQMSSPTSKQLTLPQEQLTTDAPIPPISPSSQLPSTSRAPNSPPPTSRASQSPSTSRASVPPLSPPLTSRASPSTSRASVPQLSPPLTSRASPSTSRASPPPTSRAPNSPQRTSVSSKKGGSSVTRSKEPISPSRKTVASPKEPIAPSRKTVASPKESISPSTKTVASLKEPISRTLDTITPLSLPSSQKEVSQKRNNNFIQSLLEQEPFKTLIENKKFYIILNI